MAKWEQTGEREQPRKLKPMYLYRLRILSAAPRLYTPTSINRYLERRGLIARTGRIGALPAQIEFAITDAGRAALAAAAAE